MVASVSDLVPDRYASPSETRNHGASQVAGRCRLER